MAMNNARFNNRQTHWKSAIVWISSNTALVGNKTTLCSYSSMSDFVILKGLNIFSYQRNILESSSLFLDKV
jgi:hypothetical protein